MCGLSTCRARTRWRSGASDAARDETRAPVMTIVTTDEMGRASSAADDPLRSVVLRPGTPGDAGPAGASCYEAFKTIAEQHGFSPDFPSSDVATDLIGHLMSRS